MDKKAVSGSLKMGVEGIFWGYASVFDVTDEHQEEVLPGAFKKNLEAWKQKGKLPKMLWQHDPEKPIGIWQEMREDNYGLFVKGKLLLNLPQAQEAYTLLCEGAVDALSIGFITKKARHDRVGQVRILEEIELMEISLVTFPSNPCAQVINFKEMTGSVLLKKLQQCKDILQGDLEFIF